MSMGLQTLETLTIGDMAAQSGLSEHTLRYYERIGLIQPIPRDNSSGHRRYSPETARIVENLACLRATGMPLEDMRTFLALRSRGAEAAGEQIALFVAHKETLENEMKRQQQRLKYLEAKVAYWQAVQSGDTVAITQLSEIMPRLGKELNR